MIKFIKTPDENNQYDHAKIEMEIPDGLCINMMCEHFTNFLRSIGYQNNNIIEEENEEETN